jgi:hypothetical protein
MPEGKLMGAPQRRIMGASRRRICPEHAGGEFNETTPEEILTRASLGGSLSHTSKEKLMKAPQRRS